MLESSCNYLHNIYLDSTYDVLGWCLVEKFDKDAVNQATVLFISV